MSESKSFQVIVIGAGIAGLTAAYFLAQKGISVKLFEASDRVGGRMTTDIVNDFILDRGAQFLSSEYNLLLSIAAELGLKSNIHETSPWSAIVRNGKICRMRLDNPIHTLTSGLLNLSAWLKLGWRSWQLRQSLNSLSLNDYSKWASFDNESVSSWTNRMIDPIVTEYLFEPMLQGFYFQEPEATSLSLSMALLAFGFRRSRTLSISGGIGTLAESIASRLDVDLDSLVSCIESSSDSVSVNVNNSQTKAEYVILAIPAVNAGQIFTSSCEITNRLMSTRYSTNINIAIMTNEKFLLPDHLKDVYGLLIPRAERKNIASIGIESNKNHKYTHHGQLLNIMLSNKASESMMFDKDDSIVETVVSEALKYLPGLSNKISSTRIYRWKHAEPYSHIGRAKDLVQYRDYKYLEERVLLAGDYMSMPFTEGASESGRWAAEQILKNRI
ncbi:MAG: NAD(P)/FAD-dependent oxidoreductase [Ignavibacteriales bacterium]|nr:NAD(P)/FAD-dependent oxidoreductase [Ignavibacteriales bacterium]